MARGRARAAVGDYQEALEAFTEALRARPADARAWAELGYTALLAGKDAGPALRHARALAHDRTLLAQVWFNEALFRERRGDAEGARLAFVVAEAKGSQAATQRLGEASRCAATWSTTDTAGLVNDTILLACNWREVLAGINDCRQSAAPVTTEAEAKRAACLGCVYGNVPGSVERCAGPGPWTIPEGHQNFRDFWAIVQPLPHGRFYVGPSAGSDGSDDPDAQVERAGDAFVLKRSVGANWGMGDEISLSEPGQPRITSAEVWSDDPLPDALDGGDADGQGACKPDVRIEAGGLETANCSGDCKRPVFPWVGPRELRYYSVGGCGGDDAGARVPSQPAGTPHTGALRLVLSVWSGDVKATVRGSVATISGGGCNEVTALPDRVP